MERRTIVRLLLVFGIGIPVLVEGLTLLGLVGQQLGGHANAATTTTTTTEIDAVGLGEELLAETNATEELTTASLTEVDGGWLLTLSVTVRNDGPTPYRLQLGTVVTDGGSSIPADGNVTTGVVQPGETAVVTGQWRLPTGETPDHIRVVATTVPENGTVRTVSEAVPLGSIPVEG